MIKTTEYQAMVRLPPFGAFPIDMLRYDHCWPATEIDAGKIILSLSDRRTKDPMSVAIRKSVPGIASQHYRPFTDGRWDSFAVTVTVVDMWTRE